MLAIKNNIMAANAARYLGRSYDALATSVERLSSGLRINSAKDDAAGMAVREMMRADIAVLDQAARNAQDGISMLQTMEGAMATIDNALVRMKQLAEQAMTGSYSSAQRVIMDNEFQEMAAEIERIAGSTKFNDISMLDNTDTVTIRFGTAAGDKLEIDGANMTQTGLGIETGASGYEAMSSWGVATVNDRFITIKEDNVGADALELNVQFTDSGPGDDDTAATLSYAVAQNGTTYITLDELISDINDDCGYEMASAQYDADTNKYYLKLESESATADGLTFTMNVTTTATTHAYLLDEGVELDILAVPLDVTEAKPAGGYSMDGDNTIQKGAGTGINLLTATAADTAMTAVTNAIGLKDTARAAFGYKINRLESTGEVLAIQAENLMAAESRISDVDVATEMAELTRNQVLAQAGTAMLAQANSIPQMALGLLR